MDIDIDLAPSKRPAIFDAIREERGELGLVQVATYGTEATKSAILAAARGYSTEDFPNGLDSDIAQYLTSLIPVHRGFLWPIKDVVEGNKELGRHPVYPFLQEIEKYPGLLDIIYNIEGLINKRSSHASGVIFYNEDIFETASIMRTPSGDLITQFNLHDAEAAGDTKYDFLVTEISDKIIECVKLLQQNSYIEQGDLKTIYNKYLHPNIINTRDTKIWKALASGSVLDCFQFSTGVGLDIAKKLQPKNPIEMTAANAMMRLMTAPGAESQQDRFLRIKENPDAFEREMQTRNLTREQREAMHEHCDEYNGCVPLQEQMMSILMDETLGKFNLSEANKARKIVAKKKMSEIPSLKKLLFERVNDDNLANYLWKTAIEPSLGYAFSKNHSLPYSFVGIQTLYLATAFNPIYWNTACLIVNSGGLEGSTDYGKIAKALGQIKEAGIKISLVDINKSDFGFLPDEENERILFGLRGMLNVGEDLVNEIIEKRPYISMFDFLSRVGVKKQSMISLIKGGAFDQFGERKTLMAQYLWTTCGIKKRLTLQNMNMLIKEGFIPKELKEEKSIYEFNRYLKQVCKSANGNYIFDDRALDFYVSHWNDVNYENNQAFTSIKDWTKKYESSMDKVRAWLQKTQDETLFEVNKRLFYEEWQKYAKGNYSSWEMEALCFYYHEHELAHINMSKYGLKAFNSLPANPSPSSYFKKGKMNIPLYELSRICGTCIAKNKNKGSVTLQTTEGVVEVKFRKEYFALFDKQISEKQDNGTKKVKEKSWFNRGNMIIVNGMRRGDTFIVKKYASTQGHQLYKIAQVYNNGDLELVDERYEVEE